MHLHKTGFIRTILKKKKGLCQNIYFGTTPQLTTEDAF